MPAPRTAPTPAEVILARVLAKTQKPENNDPDACWLWTGATAEGYGRIKVDGKLRQVTHVMHETFKGPVAEGMQVCHTCDVPNCINPKHLWVGTRSENMRDCKEKGRLPVMRSAWQDMRAAITAVELPEVISLLATTSVRDIADRFGVSPKAVWNLMRRYQVTSPRAKRTSPCPS